MKNRIGLVIALGLGLALTGCTKQEAETIATLEGKLAEKDAAISKMESEVSGLEAAKSKAEADARAKADAVARAEADVRKAKESCEDCEAASKMADRGSSAGAMASGSQMLPPNAKAGECYTRVLVPATYKTTTERILKRDASESVDIIPAKYEWAEEKVLAKPAATKLVEVPAEYGWEEEKILVKEAQTVWKKGRGPIEKVSDSTGEIMCLVEVPAEYRTVRKKVLKKAPSTREIAIPAEYKTVKVQRLVTSAKEVRKEIPAEYETVTRQSMASDSRMEWRPILCETNMNRTTISDIQRSLQKAGHNPGPIDGIYGRQTQAAVRSFQKANNMATGGLTINTLKKLGVRI